MMSTRAGFVAILGLPNAGKSTLLNSLVGEKLAIVTPKEQTTRTNLRGILTQDDTQMVFVDTPGIHKPRRMFDRAMVDAAWQARADSDVAVLMVDARKGFSEDVRPILESLKKSSRPVVLALNKIDLLDRERLLPLMAMAGDMKAEKGPLFRDVFAISAQKGDGVADLVRGLRRYMPESPFLYDPEQLTDAPMRILAAEVTREKAFLLLGEELPYSLLVETVTYQTKDDGSVRIEQSLLVEREGQKKIVIGAGGQMLKKIGQRARLDLEKLLGHRVHLFLHVKVRENWTTDTRLMRDFGLQPPKKG